MALPPTRVVTGKYTDPVTGEPLAGSVIFSPFPAVWTDLAGNQIMMTREVIELDDNGEFSQAVVRTDAPDVLPVQGKLWRYTENIRDNSNSGRSRAPAPSRTRYFEVVEGVGSVDVTDLISEDVPPEVAPDNAAGGDLTGTYPNPSLADTDLARTHLGLGTSATRDVGTTAGTVAAGDDPRLGLNTGAAQKSANLSDLADIPTARDNLGLGDSAVLDVGTATGTVAAGDDTRLSDARTPTGTASGDLGGTYPSPTLADTPTARSNLGLGNSATLDVGAVAGTVAAGDDTRIVNAVQRTGDTMTGALEIIHDGFDVEVARELSVASSTGIVFTSGPITQASSTSVNIPAGVAQFADHTALTQGFKNVQYGPTTVTLDDPTDPLTYFMVSDTGAIVQNAGVPTRAQRRQFAVLGRAVVLSSAIVSVQDSPVLATHPVSFVQDLLLAIGDIRVSGIRAAAIASSLTFSLTAGNIFNLGANYQFDTNDPNVSPFNAVSPAAFRYVTQTSVVDVATRTNVDPTIYDVGGTVTALPGSSSLTTIQRVHCFPTQNVFIQLGQFLYNNLAEAIDALAVGESMPFVTHPDLVGGGVRTAFIVMERQTTNLASTVTARVVRATQFGNPGGV